MKFLFRAIAAGDMVFDNFAFASVTRTVRCQFLGFVAKQSSNGSIKLLWDVADEKDVVNYVAERSSNGVRFLPSSVQYLLQAVVPIALKMLTNWWKQDTTGLKMWMLMVNQNIRLSLK